MTVQVVIGSGDQELVTALSAQFAELTGIEVIGVETTSAEVLGVVNAEQDFDVVLVDDEIGPLSAHELVREIGMRRPHGAAVLLSAKVDEDLLTRALEAGAKGVLARQPSLEELRARVVAAAEWSRGMRRRLGTAMADDFPDGRRGRMVAVCGAKGGTGATTVAVQLALAVAAHKSVCLVDMDLQTGDIPSYLDLVHRRSIADLVGVATEITGTVLGDALFIHESGPHVLLAPAEGERAEDVTALAARQILGALRARYEVVIVDCGAFMTEGSMTAVEYADRVIMTVTPDLPALRAAKRMAQLWARLKARKEEEIYVLLTRLGRRSEIQPDFAARILNLPLTKTTIPSSFRALEKAINNGTLARVEDDGYRRAIAALGIEVGVLPVDTGGEVRAGRRAKVDT
ncbi:CpaE family protein [Actinomadura sp. HBU206391]|uniref:AAA family ATPase n=1 Tax=Actinomadura sp. HBU206391 TaxID=2731692 RepID=UPI0016509B64|nr:AAA family ATPase [Actinomadura sp. HBU206391]MBC6461873.1 AAA family ATPase [Actinomadura sp. HBU206391]